ncbi:MAG: hypothetical protein QOG15_1799 [Solirubrobacteraceae bacterium]|nr:hypothetical protein [Solirubrobacteraceae bacterium]
MSLVRAVCEHFVEPVDRPVTAARPARHDLATFVPPGEDPDRACAVPDPRTPPGVALLCGPRDVFVLGAALGLLLARAERSRAVAVCVWAGSPAARAVWRAPALPGARRLAAALAARGHDARGAGRLVLVRLPPDPQEAAAAAGRAAAAAGAVPAVLALGGPRVASFDALLAGQDLVVVAPRTDADPILARLAVDGLAAQAVCACACEVPPALGPARRLAEAGLVLLPSARRALAGPIGAMT